VCLLIRQTENFSRQLRNAVFHAGFPAAALLMTVFILNRACFLFIPMSAVRLKVKINR
jgi:predicted membrane-bound mannosyltransferase